MPRPTKLAIRRAEAIGEPPSRVQGWMDAGYGPPADQDPEEHFRRLAPLMGTGRDGDVAVLKMAAYGYPCRRLPDVLRAILHPPGDDDPMDADGLVGHLMGDETAADLQDLLMAQARQRGTPVEYTAPQDGQPEVGEPGLADLMVRSAALPFAQVLAGESVEPYDTADLDRISGGEQVGMPALPFDDSGAALNLRMLTIARDIVRTADEWIEAASPDELARGVAAAQVFMDGLSVAHPGMKSWGDEQRWRRIGLVAPVASRVLDVILAVFEGDWGVNVSPDMRKYMDAMERGRLLVNRPAPVLMDSPPEPDAGSQ